MVRSVALAKGGHCLASINNVEMLIDRSQVDVDRALSLRRTGWRNMTTDERDEFLRGLRGSYTSKDMNRVNTAINFLAKLLNEYGYSNDIDAYAEWTAEDTPTNEDLDIYLGNISFLIDAFHTLPTTPPLPGDMDDFTFEEANAIEQILLDIHTVIQGLIAAFRHSGTFYSGMEGLRT